MFYDLSKQKLNVAMSSSNSGRDEEIFVAAFSFNPLDSRYLYSSLNLKDRRAQVSENSQGIDYLFCVVGLSDYRIYGNSTLGEIVNSFYSSLIDTPREFDSTDLFIEKEVNPDRREQIKIHLKRLLRLPYPMISIHSSQKKKKPSNKIKTNNLLMFADYKANQLFRSSRFDTTGPSGKYYSKRIGFPFIPRYHN